MPSAAVNPNPPSLGEGVDGGGQLPRYLGDARTHIRVGNVLVRVFRQHKFQGEYRFQKRGGSPRIRIPRSRDKPFLKIWDSHSVCGKFRKPVSEFFFR